MKRLDLTPSDFNWNIPLHGLYSSKRSVFHVLIFFLNKLFENNHKEIPSYKVESRNFIPSRIVLHEAEWSVPFVS